MSKSNEMAVDLIRDLASQAEKIAFSEYPSDRSVELSGDICDLVGNQEWEKYFGGDNPSLDDFLVETEVFLDEGSPVLSHSDEIIEMLRSFISNPDEYPARSEWIS